jgi:cytochrome c553
MKNRFLLTSLFLGGLMTVQGADVAAGKTAYEASCKKCHGADGTPVAAIAKMLKVEMKHLGSKEVQAKSDAVLKKETLEGVGKMKAMPAVEKDAANIVAYIRTLKQ